MPEAFEPPKQPDEVRIAIKAWNLMGGLDWAALPVVAEMIGCEDVERLIVQLVAIRDKDKED